MTILDLWCTFKNQKGGTIHQALTEFKTLDIKEKDKFLSVLSKCEEEGELKDLTHAKAFRASQFNRQAATMINQFDEYTANFDGKIGRKTFTKGLLCLVTSPDYANKETVLISRKATAKLNIGAKIGVDDLNKYFIKVDEKSNVQ